MKFTGLMALLPAEALVLLPVILGILVILRIVSIGKAITGIAVLFAIIAVIPILGNLLDFLPFWALILIAVIAGYSIVYAITSLVLGKGVTDHVFGEIIFNFLRLPFKLLGSIIKSFSSKA